MCQIRQFVDWGMRRFRGFDVRDVAVFKVCLLSLGMLLGMYGTRALQKVRPLVWIAAAGSYLYLVWRLIFQDEEGC